MKNSTSRRHRGATNGRYTEPKRKQRVVRAALSGLGLTGLVLPGLMAGAAPAYAATSVALYVASGGSGACTALATACGSIQTAITKAQTSYSGDDVTIQIGVGTFTEHDTITASGLNSLTIIGAGAPITIVNGGKAGSVFTVGAGTVPVTIEDLTITNGQGANGGGINNAGNLTVAAATISGNTTGVGQAGVYGRIGFSKYYGGHGTAGGNGGLGGGIENSGTLAIAASTISGNTTGAGGIGATGPSGSEYYNGGPGENGGAGGAGGGIANSGTLAITTSTISGNTSGVGGDGGAGGLLTAGYAAGPGANGGPGGAGGGVANSGTVTITTSTISANTTGTGGGGGSGGNAVGIGSGGHGGNGNNGGLGAGMANSGTVGIVSSTISSNATGAGGLAGAAGPGYVGQGLNFNGAGGAAGVYGAGGGMNNASTANLSATIVAKSASGGDCSGHPTDAGYDITDDGTCGFTGTGSVNSSATLGASLGSLADNGGPTKTVLPSALSPVLGAIPSGTAGLCPTTDQRGVNLPTGLKCAIGAVQVTTQAVSFTSTNPTPVGAGGPTYSLTSTSTSGLAVAIKLDLASVGCSLSGAIVSFTGIGTCLVDANQAGNVNQAGAGPYLPAAQAQQSIVVGLGRQAITFTSSPPSRARVGGSTYTPTATGGTSTSPVVIALDGSSTGCTLASGIVSFTATGTCVIDANQAADANYKVAPQVQQTIAVLALPGAATNVAATAGDTSASVSWTAASGNGSTVTGYMVTSSPGGLTCTTANTSCSVTGLTNGTSYSFTVVATNANGDGTASGASNGVMPSGHPGAASNVAAAAGDTSVSVSWTAASGNGSTVTGYTVTSSPGGWTCTTATTSCSVTGLTNATSYTFTVVAINYVGAGSSSLPSNSVTPATVPGAPTNVGGTSNGNASSVVSWSAPTSTGGSAIIGYTVTATDATNPVRGGQSVSGSTSPITVTGLTNADRYSFTVVATNSVGSGSPSTPSVAAVPLAPGLNIVLSVLPTAVPGTPYGVSPVVTLQVLGAVANSSTSTTTLKWTKVSLPKGMILSTTGVLSGTPNHALYPGTFALIVKVTESIRSTSVKPKPKSIILTTQATISLSLS